MMTSALVESSGLSSESTAYRFLVALAVVFAVCAVGELLCRRLRQPTVIGEMVFGIALGPCVLGLLPGHLTDGLFPTEVRPLINATATVGLVLFMFVVGIEVDLSHLGRLYRAVALSSIGAIVAPVLVGALAAATMWQVGSHDGSPVKFIVFVAIAFSATAFPVLARILDDLNISATSVGRLALLCAAVCDLVTWSALALLLPFIQDTSALHDLFVVGELVLFGVALLLARYTIRAVLNSCRERPSADLIGSGLVLIGLFASAGATGLIGVHPVFGAFAFGLAVPREALRHASAGLVPRLRDTGRLLLPAFFVSAGLNMTVSGLGWPQLGVIALVTVAATASKVLPTHLIARRVLDSPREALTLGLLLNARGLTELVILTLGRTAGVLSAADYTVLAIMAVLTTLVTSPALRYVDRLRRSENVAREQATRTGSESATPAGVG